MTRLIALRFALLFLSINISSSLYSQEIQWWYDTFDSSFGQSAADDIDGDGNLEIVFGCYRNDSSIYALNADIGTLLWKYNAHVPGAEGCNDVAPLLFDVDNDELPDVIVPSSCNPITYCFNGDDGSIKWQCDTRGSDSPPTIADIDNDGEMEILHGEFGGYVLCINALTGNPEWEIDVDLNSWIQTAPTILDLNNDDQLDFVVATWNFSDQDSIYAYRGDDQSKLWSYPVHDVMYHGTAVADFDEDGNPELLIGSYNDTLYCINGEDGSTAWKYKGLGGYVGAPASIADLDNDGFCDVVFVNGYMVTALSGNGILKWNYSIPGFAGAFRGCALSDINNDAYPDVIFGTSDGVVIALNGNNGTVIWTKDLAAHYGNDAFDINHAPLVADFNNDDSLDVFIIGGYTTYPDFENNFGRAYMLTAGVGNGPDWLMFQRDVRRQSSLCFDETTSLVELNTDELDFNIYPNPSNGNARITFVNPQNETFNISIFNSNGLLIEEILNVRGNSYELSLQDNAGGLYFVQLKSNAGACFNKKLMIEHRE